MEKNFTLKDIQIFMHNELKLNWEYKCLDKNNISTTKIADLKDFDERPVCLRVIMRVNQVGMEFNNVFLINENEFIDLRTNKDYSAEWQEYLINKENQLEEYEEYKSTDECTTN